MYKCKKCGNCCENLPVVDLIADWLIEGTSVCKNFDSKTRLCKIYESRPDLCNVEKMYESYFFNYYKRGEHYRIIKKECNKLKRKVDELCRRK
jgi:Fe-S-cluster containining protein